MDYLKYHLISGLKVGDRVKVIGTCENRAQGWSNSWFKKMDGMVGLTYTIIKDDNDAGFYIGLDVLHTWAFPCFLLEKVADPLPNPLYPTELFTLLELPLTGNIIDKVAELTTNYNDLVTVLNVPADEAEEEIFRLQRVEKKANDFKLLLGIEGRVTDAIYYVEDAISSLKNANAALEDIDL